MLARKVLAALIGIVLTAGLGWAQSSEEDHQPRILGIQIGSMAQEVLDQLKRRADGAKDEKDVTVLSWKLKEGGLFRASFFQDHVVSLELRYKTPRPTTDLWLVPLASPASSSELTAPDPRFRRDYKVTQTEDQMRVVWTREEKTPSGYHVAIQFWSASRKDAGDRYGEWIEYKYVTVPPEDRAQFKKAYSQPPKG